MSPSVILNGYQPGRMGSERVAAHYEEHHDPTVFIVANIVSMHRTDTEHDKRCSSGHTMMNTLRNVWSYICHHKAAISIDRRYVWNRINTIWSCQIKQYCLHHISLGPDSILLNTLRLCDACTRILFPWPWEWDPTILRAQVVAQQPSLFLVGHALAGLWSDRESLRGNGWRGRSNPVH